MSNEDQTPPEGSAPAPQATPPAGGQIPGADKKLLAGLMGIFLGGLGIHKFVLGYNKEGILNIVATVVTCGAGSIIGLIEGIIYLTKSDQEFVDTYVNNKKGWF